MNLTHTISNFAIGVFLILFGILLGKILNSLLRNLLSKFNMNNFFYSLTNKKVKIEETLSLIIAFIVGFFFVALGLNIMGIATVLINIVSGFIFIFILIFLVLAIKDFLPNLSAGIYLLSKKHIAEGKYVKIKDLEGEVIQIDLLETKIKLNNNEIMIIPNSQFIKNAIFLLDKSNDKVKKKVKKKTIIH